MSIVKLTNYLDLCCCQKDYCITPCQRRNRVWHDSLKCSVVAPEMDNGRTLYVLFGETLTEGRGSWVSLCVTPVYGAAYCYKEHCLVGRLRSHMMGMPPHLCISLTNRLCKVLSKGVSSIDPNFLMSSCLQLWIGGERRKWPNKHQAQFISNKNQGNVSDVKPTLITKETEKRQTKRSNQGCAILRTTY